MFHVTLHDLNNAPVLRDMAEELFENELKVKKMEDIKLSFYTADMTNKYCGDWTPNGGNSQKRSLIFFQQTLFCINI